MTLVSLHNLRVEGKLFQPILLFLESDPDSDPTAQVLIYRGYYTVA